MPALQVRDFPDELYERLKECAAREHRSVAQQTIVAVEQMIANNANSAAGSASAFVPSSGKPIFLEFDTEAARAARIKKRKELMKRIDETKIEFPPDAPSFEEIMEEARKERESRFDNLIESLMEGASR